MDDGRYERFEEAVAEMDVQRATAREVWLGRIGALLALAGPVVGVVAYVGSMSATDPLAQRDMVVLGLLGVSLTVVGMGLFVRYSVVQFFRFWAARVVYEIGAASTRPSEPAPPTPAPGTDAQAQVAATPGSGS
jgi:hypothetical protein